MHISPYRFNRPVALSFPDSVRRLARNQIMKVLSLAIALVAAVSSLVAAKSPTTVSFPSGNPLVASPTAFKNYQSAGRQRAQSLNPSRQDRKEARTYYNLGVKHVFSGKYEEAIKAFKRAILLDPQDGDAYFSLGNVYSDLGRRTEAVEAYQQAISLAQGDGEAYNNLGLAYLKLGLYRQAAEAFEQAIIIFPKWAEPRYNLSSVYSKLGQTGAATASYKEAIRLRPDLISRPSPIAAQSKSGNGVTAYEAATVRNEKTSGQRDKAYGPEPSRKASEAIRDRRVGKKPEEAADRPTSLSATPAPLTKAAPVKAISGTPTEANAKKATGSKTSDAKAFYNLGVKYGLSGKYEEAIVAFKQAILAKPNYADAYFGLGHAYADSGRWKESAEAYQQVLRLEPKDKEAQRRLDEASARLRAQTSIATSNNNGTAVGEKVSGTSTTSEASSSAPAATPTETGRVPSTSNEPTKTNEVVKPVVNSLKDGTDGTEPKAASSLKAASSTGATLVNPVSVYRVGVGDVLDIQLLNMPTSASTLYTVLEGGLVEYPPAGEGFVAAGMTTDEIKERLTSELRRRGIHANPQMMVSVREYDSHKVIISGLVNEPGTKVLRREAVPLYVVMADAQPRPEAGRVLITSYATGQTTVVDLADVGAMSTLVHPSDVLNVVARTPQFFYIGGQVNAPGQKEFHLGMTLMQAILASGGTTRSTVSKVKVSRQGADGLLVSTEYNLKDIGAGKVPDPNVRPGDRIEVGQLDK